MQNETITTELQGVPPVPPGMIWTTIGAIRAEDLQIREVFSETEQAKTVATEYYFGGAQVRRDVHVTLKTLNLDHAAAQL